MKPDRMGFYGEYGGQYVPETLCPLLEDLTKRYMALKKTASFKRDVKKLLETYVGRPSPLFYASRLSKELSCKVYFKREDLNHTGAHKINNTIGQVLVAKHMKKSRIIAETGAGQHGVATATVCALMGLKCIIYMGEEDMKRQSLNVYRMTVLGAEVRSVSTGTGTLKEATSEAIRDWMTHAKDTYYMIGSVVGPHPYPMMVREFQSIIGQETYRQIQKEEGRLPHYIVACVGGGSNAMGIFDRFIKEKSVKLIAVEAAGKGLSTQSHAASLKKGQPGILHGSRSKVLQTKEGQIKMAHSISAGLDYPGVGPELANYVELGRVSVETITDDEAIKACKWVSEMEGILPALETSHALAQIKKMRHKFKKNDIVIVNISGRGDKDMETLMTYDTIN